MVRKPRAHTAAFDVFINCPFDVGYTSLFDAMVFTVQNCRCVARCALEIDDGSEIRIEKIIRIIRECHLGIHDLSRTELDPHNNLPRFNMPLELGLFLGAKSFGTGAQARKMAVVFDIEPFRYQKFISDIAGQDVHAHHGSPSKLVAALRNWLQSVTGQKELPGADAIFSNYEQYLTDLPRMCAKLRWNPSNLSFIDKTHLIREWLSLNGELSDARIAGKPAS